MTRWTTISRSEGGRAIVARTGRQVYLRNQGKFFCAEENRERDLPLIDIDYGDLARPRGEWRNVYEVTEEFYVHNGRHGTREDVVFLINGIPVLVIECKNATEAVVQGQDGDQGAGLSRARDAQVRRQGCGQPDRTLPRQRAAQGILQEIQGNRDALRDHLAGCLS
ncbi:MAG: hypothetical protein K2Y16_05320 [Burkholderiales bacterium]|nr:hypothetical protein [Burkholderiales bacterium]